LGRKAFCILSELLLVGFSRLQRLPKLELAFGVDEFFKQIDLQGSVFVRNDVRDRDRFAVPINPDCGLELIGDMSDDLPWSVYNGMHGPLVIYQKGKSLCEIPDPLLSGLIGHTERFGVRSVTKILVQVFREDILVLLFESLSPFEDKFELRGIGALWLDIGTKQMKKEP